MSFPSIPRRLRVIDETNWDEYTYIMPGDTCLYIWERMSRLGEQVNKAKAKWADYPVNSFITNLQIENSLRDSNPDRFRHKATAIEHAALALGKLRSDLPPHSTLIPIPPSRTKDDPEYDSRLLRILRTVDPPLQDVRELVSLTKSGMSKQKGLSPDDRISDYAINEDEASPEPSAIVLFDDVLTTGSHFKAIKTVLQTRFQDALIVGLFLARAVRPIDGHFSDLF